MVPVVPALLCFLVNLLALVGRYQVCQWHQKVQIDQDFQRVQLNQDLLSILLIQLGQWDLELRVFL